MTDNLGVEIAVGDRVVVNAYGGTVRQADVYAKGTVVGFARTRVIVDWDRTLDPPARNIPGGNLGVLRRDGAVGFQGNVGRAAAL